MCSQRVEEHKYNFRNIKVPTNIFNKYIDLDRIFYLEKR